MKKLLVITLCCFILSPYVNAQDKRKLYKEKRKELIAPIYNANNDYEDDSLFISLNPTEYFMMIEVKNKTKERFYIEWENARLNGGKVVFDDDSRLLMGIPKSDEAVPGESSSLRKGITSANKMYDSSIGYLDRSKRDHPCEIDIILPIRFKDKTVDYKLTSRISYYTDEEVDSLYNIMVNEYTQAKKIKKGMSKEQVIEIMGEPIHTFNKNFVTYKYFEFYIKDGKVAKIYKD